MKQKFLLIILLILNFIFSIQLLAQDTWIQTYQPFGDAEYYPEDVLICQDGCYAVNGYYIYYDGMFYEEWGFLMKTDSDGNFLWAYKDTLSFMEENRSFAFVETSDGGFISAVSNGYLIKRDSFGNREWVNQSDIGINSMCNTSDGNIILGGSNYYNISLSKIYENGNTIWTKIHSIDDDYSICKSIIQNQDDGYTLTGYIDYEGRPDADILVVKTDEIGDSLWTKTYDEYGMWDEGRCILENNEGHLFISGYYQNDIGIYYGFLKKIDLLGNTIFELIDDINHYYGSNCLVEDSFENKIVQYGRTDNSPSLNAFSYDGDSLWVSPMSGFGSPGDRSLQIINTGFICVGLLQQNYENFIQIIKSDSIGLVTSIINFEYPNPTVTICNYPNPFNIETTISFDLQKNINNPTIEVFNIKGEKVRELPIVSPSPAHTLSVKWDGTDNYQNQVSSGVYLYKLSAGKTSVMKKMLLLK